MSHELRIRDLEAPDLEALLSLYRHLHAEDDPLPPRGEVERLWEEIAPRGSICSGWARTRA